jgi:hypothetical protein
MLAAMSASLEGGLIGNRMNLDHAGKFAAVGLFGIDVQYGL